jgi:nucleotide-binding universal stress UspA family protein
VYKKMLVLLDGSKLAEMVFTYAQELSGRLNIDLELLNVCSPQESELLPMRQAYMEHMAEELQKKAEEVRVKYGAALEATGIKAKGSVVVGYPPEEILKYAEANNIELIMLTTHGHTGIKMWDLGSVAHKVIHATKIPIWLVPAELREEVIFDKLPERHTVIPLDGSRLAEGVIPHAITISKQRGAVSTIILVWVQDTTVTKINLADIRRVEEERAGMVKYLANMVNSIQNSGISARSEILQGDPAATLIEYVKNNPAQLIAMATHAHAGISRMVFGSMTENVIRLVKKTPILLVRPKE